MTGTKVEWREGIEKVTSEEDEKKYPFHEETEKLTFSSEVIHAKLILFLLLL